VFNTSTNGDVIALADLSAPFTKSDKNYVPSDIYSTNKDFVQQTLRGMIDNACQVINQKYFVFEDVNIENATSSITGVNQSG
jgi:hypothetical protein